MLGLLKTMNSRAGRRAGGKDSGRRGLSALEFALIAPVFFMMLIGVTEMSLVMLATHLIESATYNASRTAKTGYIEAGKTQLETVMDVLNYRLGSLAPLIDVSKVTTTYTAYGNLSSIGQPEQGEDNSLGTAEQVVVYTVSYPWKVFTPMIGNLIGDENGIITLSSRIVVRNEPYD